MIVYYKTVLLYFVTDNKQNQTRIAKHIVCTRIYKAAISLALNVARDSRICFVGLSICLV